MRTTVTLHDELLEHARRLTGLEDGDALIRAALISLIERESARELVRLGGTEPTLQAARRRGTTGS
jgi:hypothetical protein